MTDIQTPQSTPRPEAEASLLTPTVDILESADEYLLVADLPGVASDDVQLELEGGELTLRATRSLSRDGESLALGRLDGDYHRLFRIPEEVDGSAVEASFDHGVLRIRLPKSERVKPRRISVKAVH